MAEDGADPATPGLTLQRRRELVDSDVLWGLAPPPPKVKARPQLAIRTRWPAPRLNLFQMKESCDNQLEGLLVRDARRRALNHLSKCGIHTTAITCNWSRAASLGIRERDGLGFRDSVRTCWGCSPPWEAAGCAWN